MRILCKEKDFYDFVGYEFGSEDIVFDRRSMRVFKRGTEWWDANSVGRFVAQTLAQDTKAILGIWIGFCLHIFKIIEISNKYNDIGQLSEKFKYDVNLIASRRCYDIKHNYPIEFVRIKNTNSLDFFLEKKAFENYALGSITMEEEELVIKALQESKVSNWEFEYDDYLLSGGIAEIPILKDTWIPRFLKADAVYRDIEEWLLAQHNDVSQESKNLTDTDKAVNHGFDKKISFRNCK